MRDGTETLIREEGTKVPEALVVLGTERPERQSPWLPQTDLCIELEGSRYLLQWMSAYHFCLWYLGWRSRGP